MRCGSFRDAWVKDHHHKGTKTGQSLHIKVNGRAWFHPDRNVRLLAHDIHTLKCDLEARWADEAQRLDLGPAGATKDA